MKQLLDLGFIYVGYWSKSKGELHFELTLPSTQENVLYAFIMNHEIMYIGMTIQSIRNRLMGYKNPDPSQKTNFRIHKLLKESLEFGNTIEIYILPDAGLLQYGDFQINLAAGLEKSVISKISPIWNLIGKETYKDYEDFIPVHKPFGDNISKKNLGIKELENNLCKIRLGKAYWEKGFFNIPVSHGNLVGDHGAEIRIICENKKLIGRIDRKANLNGTPRIFQGAILRDWFQDNFNMGDLVDCEIRTPQEIKLQKIHNN